jgi:hypothetical protein
MLSSNLPGILLGFARFAIDGTYKKFFRMRLAMPSLKEAQRIESLCLVARTTRPLPQIA